MSDGALGAMMGVVPLVIAGGIAVGITERMLGPTGPRGRRQRGMFSSDTYHRPSRRTKKPKNGASFYGNEFANSPAFRAGAKMRRGYSPSDVGRRFANPY